MSSEGVIGRLFDPDVLRTQGLYVGLPMAGHAEAQGHQNTKILETVDGALASFCTSHSFAGPIEILTGQQDSVPWEGSRSEFDIARTRTWIRRRLMRDANGYVAVLTRESVGCGKELALALALGLPTAVFQQEDAPASVHAGHSPYEAPAHLYTWKTYRDLGTRVTEWLEGAIEDLARQQSRREAWIRSSEPARLKLHRAWHQLTDAQRTVAARLAFLTVEHLSAVLADPVEFASHWGPFAHLGEVLGLWGSVATDEQIGDFSSSELDALDAAVDNYMWRPDQVVTVVRRATELRAMSGTMRGRLSTPRGWRRLLETPDVRPSPPSS